jgi:DNA-binding response OmpR family regulator
MRGDPDRDNQQAERPLILFVDPDAGELYVPSLRTHGEAGAVSTKSQALRILKAFRPTLVIVELALPDGDGLSVCRESKAMQSNPPTVLVTTAVPEHVPDALVAGCDGVLLKPFAPNLLYSRIGRLLRQRAAALRERAIWHRAQAAFSIEPSAHVPGTNVVWPDVHCPSCGQGNAVSFDAASYRRMWYACVACRTVWLAPTRQAIATARGTGRLSAVPSQI